MYNEKLKLCVVHINKLILMARDILHFSMCGCSVYFYFTIMSKVCCFAYAWRQQIDLLLFTSLSLMFWLIVVSLAIISTFCYEFRLTSLNVLLISLPLLLLLPFTCYVYIYSISYVSVFNSNIVKFNHMHW